MNENVEMYGELTQNVQGCNMDRRQKKTREAIFRAFSKLLEKKRYENITVQEIIDEADIGRSTFYAHFETKDELLHSMCRDIFEHVFCEQLPKEADHDYSDGKNNLELKLGHIMYHLREHKLDLKGILSSESGEIFMKYFREYLNDLFVRYHSDFKVDVPDEFLLNHLITSFCEVVKWWITGSKEYSPEEVAGFYIAVIEKH